MTAAVHSEPGHHALDCLARLVPVKARRGAPTTPAAWLEVFGLGFTVLPVTPGIAWTAAAFAWSHRDPCDRHILATAVVRGLPLVTIDPEIAAFAPGVGVKIVW